jgi:chromosome segregation ATPase
MIDFFDWAWIHMPHLTAVGMIVFAAVWLTIKINNFGHRIDATERLCIDIQHRQLPEIRSEVFDLKGRMSKVEDRMSKVEDGMLKVEERISKVEDRLSKVEEKLSKIELTLNRIETFLLTTTSKYPG